jgi:hypothetical protein
MNKKRNTRLKRSPASRAPAKPSSDSDARPLVFISHRHTDKNIADVIRKFLKSRSGGRVQIFQSSTYAAEGPQIGRNLNQQLMQNLWKAAAVILVYTTPDQDWSYCMWECGVATDPRSPDTRVILFQSGGRPPTVFADQVRVKMGELVDIQRFTNEFLTSKQFFPAYAKPMAPGFHENGSEVLDAAQELFEKLQQVAPLSIEEPPIEEWPAFPFLQLELGLDHVQTIGKTKEKSRVAIAKKLIKQNCIIRAGDKVAEQLFGVPSLSAGMPFQRLIEKWLKKNPRSKSKWIDAIQSQIIDGVQWEFPQAEWELMPGLDRQSWYAPMLTRVRKIPSKACMQFDVYFYKFSLDQEGKLANIHIPAP